MLDSQLLRRDAQHVATALARRGFTLDLATLDRLEQQRKRLQTQTEELQAERNRRSKAIGEAKARGEDIVAARRAVVEIGERLKENHSALEVVQSELETFALELPNLPHPDIPDGTSEADNTEVRRWGAPRGFDFQPRDHVELGEGLGGIDFEAGARLASARFAVL